MKLMRAVVAACAVLAAMSSVAHADLILVGATPAQSFTDLGAQGFGAAPRLLTLQTNTVETGNETPVDVEHGDAVNGANKSTTPTLATLGWTSGAEVGIGFNSDQSGQTGITMQSLALTIFDGTTAVHTFNLAASETPLTFTAADLALQQGNGNAVFNFHLTAPEQAQFDAILLMPGSSGFFAGLGSQLGCPAGAPGSCLVSNDGPDSFVGFKESAGTPVPEPSTLSLVGFSLVGLAYWARKRSTAF